MQNNNRIIKKMFEGSLMVIILTTITTTLGMLVDGIVIGNFLGVDAMAAYGIVSPAFIVSAAVGGIFSSGCQTLTNEEGYVAKINIATKAGSLETDYDLANTVRDKFAAANSVEVRINDHSVSEIQAYYGGFGTQRFLGNLYVGMLHGADAKIKVDSATYSENTDGATVKVVFDLEDYNYVDTGKCFSGNDITLEFHGAKKDSNGNFTATSVEAPTPTNEPNAAARFINGKVIAKPEIAKPEILKRLQLLGYRLQSVECLDGCAYIHIHYVRYCIAAAASGAEPDMPGFT